MTKWQATDKSVTYVTPAQAARMTGLTTGHLARMADAGRIHATRPAGTHRRYPIAEIEALANPEKTKEDAK